MPRYMLDTDAISCALRGVGAIGGRLQRLHPSSLCISSLVLAELRYGAVKRHSKRLNADIDVIAKSFAIAAFDRAAADRFGSLAVQLEAAGTPIGTFDTLIASHALSLHATLITNNLKHFSVVPGLLAESWT